MFCSLIFTKSSDILNKNTQGAKKGEANQKQQLSEIAILATKSYQAKAKNWLASYVACYSGDAMCVSICH